MSSKTHETYGSRSVDTMDCFFCLNIERERRETAITESKDNRGDVSQAVDVIGKLRLSWMTVVSRFGWIDPFLSCHHMDMFNRGLFI